MVAGGTGEIKLMDLMTELLASGSQFQEKVAGELERGTNTTRLLREALSLLRNALCIRLNDTVTTAIWDCFVELTRRLRTEHDHMMRKVYLYELIEGSWPDVCSTFAELVRSQLQFTRATDTAATAYISHQMKSSIAYKLEIAYRKMIKALCVYLPNTGPPSFHVPNRVPAPRAPAALLPPPPPAGGGSGPSLGPPPPPPDSDVLRDFWNYRRTERERRAAEARQAMRRVRRDPADMVVPNSEVTTDAGRLYWLKYTLFSYLRSGGVWTWRLFRYMIHRISGWDTAPVWYFRRENACRDYYAYLRPDLRAVVVNICQMIGNMESDNPAERLLQSREWRWRPQLPQARRHTDGLDYYVVPLISARMPANVRDNDEREDSCHTTL